nr:MAG TPA: hypothetical protein [Crassvirales sp.]
MANQYTGEAYMGVKPVEADFGQVGMNALNIDMSLRAAGLEQEKLYAKQAKEAQQKLEADLKDFDKLATESLNLQPQAFDQQGVAILMEHTQQEIADMRRELANPLITPTRKSEIMVKIGDMKNKAASYTNQMKSFQTFLEGLSKTGKGGIDDVMNVGLIGTLNEAVLLAGKEGIKDKGNGIYSMGGMIDMYYANGMLNYIMYDKNGEALATGSPAELQAKLSGKLKPFVDLDGLMNNSIKQIGDSVVRSFQRTPDGNILNIESTNLNNIKQRAGDYWEATFRNNYETNPYMQKGATVGLWDTPEQAKAYFVDRVAMAADQNVKQSLQRDPNYVSYSESRKMENVDVALDYIQRALNGEKDAIQRFVGTKSISYVNKDGENVKAQLEGISSAGDVTTLHFVSEGKKRQGQASSKFDQGFDISFKMDDPESVKQATLYLKDYWNGGAQSGEKLLDSDILNGFNFNVSPRVIGKRVNESGDIENDPVISPYIEKIRSISNDIIEGKNKGTSTKESIRETLQEMINSGALQGNVRTDDLFFWRGQDLVLEDREGNEVFAIRYNDPEKFAGKIINELGKITSMATSTGGPRVNNPQFLIGARRGGNQTSRNVTVRSNNGSRGLPSFGQN